MNMNVKSIGSGVSGRVLMVAGVFGGAAVVLAQEAAPAVAVATGAGGESAVTGFFVGVAQSHPWVATVLLVIGALRVVFKPVMALVDGFVKSNCSAEEYSKLQAFESGPIYKWISFAFDFFGSVKLPVIGIKPASNSSVTK